MPRTRHWYYRLVVCLFSFSGGFPPGPPWKSINHSVIKGSCMITLPRNLYYFLQLRGTRCEKPTCMMIGTMVHDLSIHFLSLRLRSLFSIVSTFYGRYAVIIFLWVVFSEFFAPALLFFDPARIFFFSPADKMRTVCSDTEELADSWELKKRTRTKKICPSPQFGPDRGIGRFSFFFHA